MDNYSNNIMRPQQQRSDDAGVRPADALGVRIDGAESAFVRPRRAVRYDSGVHYADCAQGSPAAMAALSLGVVSLLILLLTPMVRWLAGVFVVTSVMSVYAGVKALRSSRTARTAYRVMAYTGILLSVVLLTVFVLTVVWMAYFGYQLPY